MLQQNDNERKPFVILTDDDLFELYRNLLDRILPKVMRRIEDGKMMDRFYTLTEMCKLPIDMQYNALCLFAENYQLMD